MIACLRELLAAATPGEWEGVPNHPMPTADYDLIVTAHNALPALLDCVEAAKAMREAFGKHQGYWPQMGWTPVEFDAALKRLEGGE